MSSEKYFIALMRQPDDEMRLAEAALQIAVEEYPEINIHSYLDLLTSWSAELRHDFSGLAPHVQIEKMNDLLFGRMNFTGNVENYYDPRNSFLNDVIDLRKGIPISLSVVYLEIAWRLGVNAAGISFPGHFLVRVMQNEEPLFVDPFHQGKVMTRKECIDFWRDISDDDADFQDNFLAVATKRQIVNRMLRNLKGIYLEQKNYKKLIPVLDKLIILSPEVPEEIRDRGMIHYRMQAFRLALSDFETYLSICPNSEDISLIQQYLQVLREYTSHLN